VTCGHRKPIDGNPDPLVCNLDLGHEPPHGIRLHPDVPPFVTWPDTWEVQPAPSDRLEGWRKPHKRGKYLTLKMWKAGQR